MRRTFRPLRGASAVESVDGSTRPPACRLRLLALAPALAFLVACDDRNDLVEERLLTIAHEPGSSIEVLNAGGGVRVRTDRRRKNVVVAATVVATSFTDARHALEARLANIRIDVHRDDEGTLRLQTVFTGRRRSGERCDLDITVPEAHGARIVALAGRADVRGLVGGLEVRGDHGVRVEDHSGDVTAKSPMSVRITDVAGRVDVEGEDGDVRLYRVRREVRAKTRRGDIRLEPHPENGCPFQLEAKTGRVRARLTRQLGGRVLATSGVRAVRLRGHRRRVRKITGASNQLEIRLGRGSCKSMLTSYKGRVEVDLPR